MVHWGLRGRRIHTHVSVNGIVEVNIVQGLVQVGWCTARVAGRGVQVCEFDGELGVADI